MFLLWKKKQQDDLYPSFLTRNFASVIDTLLATIIIIPVANILYIHGSDILLKQSIQAIVLGLLILGFWIRAQATPGKMLFAMKIVSNKNMGKPTIFQYCIRLLSYPISIIPFGLGIFYILVNKKHRAFHDIIAGTLVISEKHLKDKK